MTESNDANIGILAHAISDDLVLLSALHATELEAQTLVELKHLGFPEGLGLRFTSERGATILDHLSKVIKTWPDQVDEAFLHGLAADYAAIYLNAQLGASPHESFWLDEESLVMQKPMFEVRDLYRENGMHVENWRSRADDHLVNELNFMAEIIKDDGNPAALSIVACFMDEHLLRWIDQFSDRVASHCESDFYIGLMLLTAVYCDELRDLLATILEQPRPTPEEVEARLREKQPEPIKVAPPQTGCGPGW